MSHTQKELGTESAAIVICDFHEFIVSKVLHTITYGSNPISACFGK